MLSTIPKAIPSDCGGTDLTNAAWTRMGINAWARDSSTMGTYGSSSVARVTVAYAVEASTYQQQQQLLIEISKDEL